MGAPLAVSIQFLKAHHGDCILVTIEDSQKVERILIDGGPSYTFKTRTLGDPRDGDLKNVLDKLRDQDMKIDLVILTHVDDDHIGGLISAFEDPDYLSQIALKVIFNSGQLIHEYFKVPADPTKDIEGNFAGNPETSIRQGDTLEKHLVAHKLWDRKVILQETEYPLLTGKLQFLSPNEEKLNKLLIKWEEETETPFTAGHTNDWHQTYVQLLENDKFEEDQSVPNGSSVGFILLVNELKFIFLGDAHPSTILLGLKYFGYDAENPLNADMVKVSHHGSKKNTSIDLLDVLKSESYVISTDGSRHGLPNKVTLARIHSHSTSSKIYFNYDELISDIYNKEELVELAERVLFIHEELVFD